MGRYIYQRTEKQKSFRVEDILKGCEINQPNSAQSKDIIQPIFSSYYREKYQLPESYKSQESVKIYENWYRYNYYCQQIKENYPFCQTYRHINQVVHFQNNIYSYNEPRDSFKFPSGYNQFITPNKLSETFLDNIYSQKDGLFMRERIVRKRALFTRFQLSTMNKVFEEKKYISSSERLAISKQINVGEKQLKIWWQNKRNKEKMKKEIDTNRCESDTQSHEQEFEIRCPED